MVEGDTHSIYQHQPLNSLREIRRQVGHNRASHRVAYEAGLLDLQTVQPSFQVERGFVKNKTGLAPALTKPDQIHHIEAEFLGQGIDIFGPPPGRSGEAMHQDQRVPGANHLIVDGGRPNLNLPGLDLYSFC